MDYKKLEELNNLRLSGALTEEEFEAEKKKLLDEELPPIAEPLPFGLHESSYLGLMNFLIFVPYVGWVVPLVLWLLPSPIIGGINGLNGKTWKYPLSMRILK